MLSSSISFNQKQKDSNGSLDRLLYNPHTFNKTQQDESPENPQFYKHGRHVFIMTNAGRPVYVRYGDEIKSSIFIATLNAIIQKYLIFYQADKQPQQLFKVQHHNITIYVLQRKQLIYICASKHRNDAEINIQSMLEFLNTQLISCVTDNVNTQLLTRFNYDLRGLMGGTMNLLQLTIKNGINSPCILLNSLHPLPMNASLRSNIHTTLRDKQQNAICTLLMNETLIIDICRSKDNEIQNLIQSQAQLRKSEHWVPICLPGLSAVGMLQAYIHFFNPSIAIVMITDDNTHDQFFRLKEVSKEIVEKFTVSQQYNNQNKNNNIINSILTCIEASPTVPKCFEGQSSIKHFIVKHSISQIFLPLFQPFGKQPKRFKQILHQYGRIYSEFLQNNQGTNQDTQKKNYFSCGSDGFGLSQYYDLIVNYYYQFINQIFFQFDRLIDFNQVQANIHTIQKMFKPEDLGNFFILKQT